VGSPSGEQVEHDFEGITQKEEHVIEVPVVHTGTNRKRLLRNTLPSLNELQVEALWSLEIQQRAFPRYTLPSLKSHR
jgi:hypothetical protein